MTHGDDKGLILPPRIAPHQVVIVPIGREDRLDEVTAAAKKLAKRLSELDIRAHVDERAHLSPGFKFNDWELRGAPVRLELGPRDLAAGATVMARRNSGAPAEKEHVALADAPQTLKTVLEEIQAQLLQQAAQFRDERTVAVDAWERFVAAVQAGWAQALHCGRTECEDDIKAETAATPRCVPLAAPPEQGPCVRCGLPSAYGKRVTFGRAY